MAVQELFWIPMKKNRKTGETSTFPTKTAFVNTVDTLHGSVHMEATDKVRGFSGSLLDIPDGAYIVKGPGFKKYTWEGTLTVNRSIIPPYTVG